MFTPHWDIFNLPVALVTWISQRVAVVLPVIIEQASSSEALIWKMNTPGLSGEALQRLTHGLGHPEIAAIGGRTRYGSWTCGMSIKCHFIITGREGQLMSLLSWSVIEKQNIYFDKRKNTSRWEVAGFTGQVLDDLAKQPNAFVSRWGGGREGEINNSDQERHSLYRHLGKLPWRNLDD